MSIETVHNLQSNHLNVEDFTKLPREEQEQYLKTMNREVSWLKSMKLMLYVPTDKQMSFHTSLCPRRALFGGNRTGKTTSGGMEFLFHITGQYPEWYPETMKLKGSIKGRIIAKDFQKGVGEVITPFLDEWLDEGMIQRKVKNPMGIPTKYYLKNGSVFDIAILNYAFNQVQVKLPWHFRNVRDVRTVTDLTYGHIDPKDYVDGTVAHNALSDAIYQANYLSDMLKKIEDALKK